MQTSLKDVHSLISDVLLLNELSGNENLKYIFSDADGYRTGRSGCSFGLCQFDIENNWDGLLILKEIGIKPKDIKDLYLQLSESSIERISRLIQTETAKRIIDRADKAHITKSITHVMGVINELSSPVMITVDGLVALVDYHTQMHLSINGKMHEFIKNYPSIEVFDNKTVRDFKLNNTLWGKNRPDDVNRRYDNIFQTCSKKSVFLSLI